MAGGLRLISQHLSVVHKDLHNLLTKFRSTKITLASVFSNTCQSSKLMDTSLTSGKEYGFSWGEVRRITLVKSSRQLPN